MKEACLRLSSRQKARSQLTTILISKAFHRPCSGQRWVLAMLGMNSCGGSDPGLSAAFDLRYVTVASQSAGRLRRDGRLYRSHQRDVFSCSKFLADYNFNGVLTRYKARRRLSHSSRHSFSHPAPDSLTIGLLFSPADSL